MGRPYRESFCISWGEVDTLISGSKPIPSVSSAEPLPSRSAIQQAFGLTEEPSRHKILLLPVLANPLCEHHLVLYTAALSGGRVRLVAFAKRESRDPKVPVREWSVLCSAEMPEARVDEFVSLLQERLDGAPVELRDLDLGDLSA